MVEPLVIISSLRTIFFHLKSISCLNSVISSLGTFSVISNTSLNLPNVNSAAPRTDLLKISLI
ncbi:MAG: hypothetical protein LBC61_01710 [Candidatus Peribacteria bacterium]|nr:hypothetical protein [Candidatus Peribacteria bacterium]